MTSYSRRRSYPTPASVRERANGGLDSELLGRAVAVDLDGVDAAWPQEANHSTVIYGLSGTQTGLIYNDYNNLISFNTLEAASAGGEPGLFSSAAQGLSTVAGGEGWYHVKGSVQAQASGTVNAGALHRLQLRIHDFSLGGIAVETYYADTQQQGANTNWTNVEAVVRLTPLRQAYLYYLHLNVGSTVNALATGTYLSGYKICGDV